MAGIETPPSEEWDENGDPLTLTAAAADALEWCKLMQRKEKLGELQFSQPHSADDLKRCIDLLAHQLESHWSKHGAVQAPIDCLKAQDPAQIDDWHEDDGSVLWWKFPIQEPPWCGQPTDSDWPGYHTHWTPLLVPNEP